MRPLGRKDMQGRAQRVRLQDVPQYFRIIGRLVRDARLERDVSLSELAAAIGTDQHHIARLERGVIRPKTNTKPYGPSTGLIVRIALALNMQPSELMP